MKGRKTVIPHHTLLARFVRDCVEAPHSLKALYLNLGHEGALPPRLVHAYHLHNSNNTNNNNNNGNNERERGTKYVAENATPLDAANKGHAMLKLMGWTGGGLGISLFFSLLLLLSSLSLPPFLSSLRLFLLFFADR